MKKSIYKIKINKNWSKYNPGKRKNYNKVMISNRFLDDAKIRILTPVTRLLYIACLLATCESDEGQCEVSHELLVSQSGVKSGSIRSQLDQLQSLQLLSYDILTPLILIKENIREEEEQKRIEPPDVVESVQKSKVQVSRFSATRDFDARFNKSKEIKEIMPLLKTLYRETLIPPNIENAIPRMLEVCDNDMKKVEATLEDIYQNEKIATGKGLTGSHSNYVSRALIQRFGLE